MVLGGFYRLGSTFGPFQVQAPEPSFFLLMPYDIIIIIMYIYHVEHSPTKTVYIKYYTEKQTRAPHTHTHTHNMTVAETGY